MKESALVVKFIFAILLIATIIYGILGSLIFPKEGEPIQKIFEMYTDNWVYVSGDGTRVPVEIPSSVEVTRGEKYSVENTLPVIRSNDMYVIVRAARQDVNIYIDGKLRKHFSSENTRTFGKYSPTFYIMTRLTTDDSGKTVTIEYQADNRNSGAVGEVYYANNAGFLDYEFKLQGGVFVIGIVLLILSSITIIISGAISIMYRKEVSLLSISVSILGVSIWILSNSVFRQYLSNNVSAISDVSFVILPLIVAPFSSYVNQVMKRRYNLIYTVISGLAVLVALVSTILHVLKIVDYMDSFWGTAVVFILLLGTAIVTLIIETVNKHIEEYMVNAVAFMIAGGCMFVQMIIYIRGQKAYDVSVAALGLFVMLVLAIVDTVKDVYGTYKERDRAKYESVAKSQFLAKMSHEIRTPINAILGMNTMILRKSNDADILGYANNINGASNSLLSLVNDILDFSKIESGKMELVPVQYEFMDVVNDIYNMINTKANEKDLIFEVDIDRNIPSELFGDDVRIKQILVNLLTNAIKYTPSGKVSLQIYKNAVGKLVDGETNGVSLHFAVKDTGIGIKQEDISKLTDEFVRIEESRNRNIEGTGLGINIVVSLLNMMDSKIEVSSVYGEGSVFSFDLVQEIRNENIIGNAIENISKGKADKEEYVSKLYIPDSKLLVVDDNEMNRVVFTCLASELQCQVDTAESGQQCLELVTKNKYDIIFMDHMMPEMDGIETLHHMKEFGDYINSKTPVIILTANAIKGAEEEYISEGFDGYLSKPLDADRFEDMVAKLIPDEKKK